MCLTLFREKSAHPPVPVSSYGKNMSYRAIKLVPLDAGLNSDYTGCPKKMSHQESVPIFRINMYASENPLILLDSQDM